MKLSILILFYCIVFHTHTHTHTHRDIYLLAQKFTLPSKLGVVGLNMQRSADVSIVNRFRCASHSPDRIAVGPREPDSVISLSGI